MKKEKKEFDFLDMKELLSLKKRLQVLKNECLEIEKTIQERQNDCSHKLIVTNRETDYYLAFGLGEKVICLLCGQHHKIYHDRYHDVFQDKLVIDLTKKDYADIHLDFILKTFEEKIEEYKSNHPDASLNEIYQYLNHLSKEDFSYFIKMK